MILDIQEKGEWYGRIHPRLAVGFAQIQRSDLATLPVGRNTVHAWLHVDIVKGPLIPRAQSRVEVHARYVDIHVPLVGSEEVGWMEAGRMRMLDRRIPEKDAELFSDPCDSWVVLKPGFFALFWPGEGHAPMVGAGEIHKAVIKVALTD